MTKLTRKEIKYEWNDPCERAFQELKRRLTSAPILIVPKREQGYTVYCDASKEGLGCVLMQSCRMVANGSQQLKNHERNYPTHDMELAAIVFALKIQATIYMVSNSRYFRTTKVRSKSLFSGTSI